jgi:hypothetical protein
LIVSCLARDPNDRPQNAGAVIEILDCVSDAGAWGPREAETWWDENQERIMGLQQPRTTRATDSRMTVHAGDRSR